MPRRRCSNGGGQRTQKGSSLCLPSRLVQRQHAFLNTLRRTRSPKRLNRLITAASKDQLRALVEIAFNILSPQSKFKLLERQKRPLYAHAQLIRRISRARTPIAARLAVQKGGALGALAPLLAPVVLAIAKSLLFKRSSSSSSSKREEEEEQDE